jgi:hypothetical protein
MLYFFPLCFFMVRHDYKFVPLCLPGTCTIAIFCFSLSSTCYPSVSHCLPGTSYLFVSLCSRHCYTTVFFVCQVQAIYLFFFVRQAPAIYLFPLFPDMAMFLFPFDCQVQAIYIFVLLCLPGTVAIQGANNKLGQFLGQDIEASAYHRNVLRHSLESYSSLVSRNVSKPSLVTKCVGRVQNSCSCPKSFARRAEISRGLKSF